MKDCFFSKQHALFTTFQSTRHHEKSHTPILTPLPTPHLPPKKTTTTKQKIRQVTDQKRVFKGQASFFGSCFSSGWLQLCFRLYWKLNKTLFPDKTCTLNINDRNWLSNQPALSWKYQRVFPPIFSNSRLTSPLENDPDANFSFLSTFPTVS